MQTDENYRPRKRRAGAIVAKGDQLLVNWRWRHGQQFYVLPGGLIEEGEDPEQAAVREIDEETSLVIEVDRLAYHLRYSDVASEQWYFLGRYISGEPAIRPDAEEQETNAQGDDVVRPMWLPLRDLSRTTLYPLELRDALIEDILTNFASAPRTIEIEWATRRQ